MLGKRVNALLTNLSGQPCPATLLFLSSILIRPLAGAYQVYKSVIYIEKEV